MSIYKSKEEFLQSLLVEVSKEVGDSDGAALLVSSASVFLGAGAAYLLSKPFERGIERLAERVGMPVALLVGAITGVGGFIGGLALAPLLLGAFASEPEQEEKKKNIDKVLRYSSEEYDRIVSLKEQEEISEIMFEREILELYSYAKGLLQKIM